MTLLSHSAGSVNFYGTLAQLSALYPAATYDGFDATTSDFGPVWSIGGAWSVGSALPNSYTPPGTGAVPTTVASKLANSESTPSVLDFGADGSGVADSTAAFTLAANSHGGTANAVVYVPPNTYKLNSTPAPLGGVLWVVPANTFLTGVGGLSGLGFTNTPLIQYLHEATKPTDFATLYVRRNATHTGGTPGVVNAGFRVDTYVSSGAADYEWSLIGVMQNSATGGQNVGGYLQGNKNVTNAGNTWGAVCELRENVAIADPTTGSVGLEVDNRTNGTDANKNRVGIDVVITRLTPGSGPVTTCSYGVRIQTAGEAANALIGTGFSLFSSVTCAVGFDTSASVITQAAYKMAQGQGIAFDAAALHQIFYDGTALGYKVSGASKVRLLDTGILECTGGHVISYTGNIGTSSGTTPVLTANKPGASTAIGAWISVTIDGTQFWVPAWSN